MSAGDQLPQNPYGITREEILDLAAQKVADQIADHDTVERGALNRIEDQIKNLFESGLNKRIDEFLTKEMDRLMGIEICPVDIFGEKTGKPTTIRQVLSERAKDFWEVKVDKHGKMESWGGTPRWKHAFDQFAEKAFSEAIKQNSETIIQGFKAAMKADTCKRVEEYINRFIK